MSRRFTIVTVALTAVVAFLVGAIVAGGLGAAAVVADGAGAPVIRAPAPTLRGAVGRCRPAAARQLRRRRRAHQPGGRQHRRDRPRRRCRRRRARRPGARPVRRPSLARDNAAARRRQRVHHRRRRQHPDEPPRHRAAPSASSSSCRTAAALRAHVIGADPDTDIALIKVDGQQDLPVAPLGDSSTLRMGEWVCAIGNPLGYEHTVTVGVVSFVGRKLFDASLDNYIQTDAAINFGNSGGPLINCAGRGHRHQRRRSARGRATSGLPCRSTARPPSCRSCEPRGRVSRGYIGVGLRDVDADLQRSLEPAGRRRARSCRT